MKNKTDKNILMAKRSSKFDPKEHQAAICFISVMVLINFQESSFLNGSPIMTHLELCGEFPTGFVILSDLK